MKPDLFLALGGVLLAVAAVMFCVAIMAEVAERLVDWLWDTFSDWYLAHFSSPGHNDDELLHSETTHVQQKESNMATPVSASVTDRIKTEFQAVVDRLQQEGHAIATRLENALKDLEAHFKSEESEVGTDVENLETEAETAAEPVVADVKADAKQVAAEVVTEVKNETAPLIAAVGSATAKK